MEIFFNRLIGTKRFWLLVGTLLIVAIIITGLVYLKKIKYKNRYHSHYMKVKKLPAEITIGSSINLFGLKVGKVEGIGINKDYDGADLHVSILDDVNENLKTDACLTVIPTLFGTPELKLDPGKNPELLGEKDTIRLVVEESVDFLIRKSLNPIYKKIIPSINSGVDSFSRIGKRLDSVNFDKIGLIMKGFEENMQQTSALILSLSTQQPDLRNILVKMNSAMDDVVSFTSRINRFAENTFGDDKDLVDAINKIAANAESLLQNGNVISLKAKVLLETYKSEKDLATIIPDSIEFTKALHHFLKKTEEIVNDFSTISKTMQNHWLLKSSIKHVNKDSKEGEYFLGDE